MARKTRQVVKSTEAKLRAARKVIKELGSKLGVIGDNLSIAHGLIDQGQDRLARTTKRLEKVNGLLEKKIGDCEQLHSQIFRLEAQIASLVQVIDIGMDVNNATRDYYEGLLPQVSGNDNDAEALAPEGDYARPEPTTLPRVSPGSVEKGVKA